LSTPSANPAPGVDAVFGALADPTRRRLIETLSATSHATPTTLARELPMTRQAVAKHLATLSGAGLVRSTRAGREMRYELQPEALGEAAAWIATVGGEWEERLAGLQRLLAKS